MSEDADAGLIVENLRTRFGPDRAGATVVDGVSFALRPGRTVALVGESGCGKSATALSLMRLIEPPGRILSGRVLLDGRDLLAMSEREMEGVRGAKIGMIFQDPLTSLNPALTIGWQISETILAHQPISRAVAEQKAIELLRHVGVNDAERRAHDYPHHFSGGMRQRVLIAAAISCRPRSSSRTNPRPRSTSRSRQKSFACCAIFSRRWMRPCCSSRMTSASSPPWRTR